MRVPTALLSLVVAATAAAPAEAAGPLLRLHPAEVFAPTRFELEYLRPWAGVPVDQGRAVLGRRLPGRLWVGAAVDALRAPTLDEMVFSAWARWGRVVRAEYGRGSVRIGTLEPVPRQVGRVDLRLPGTGWELGASAELLATAVGSRQWRSAWCGVSVAASELVLSRSSTPWSEVGAWQVVLRMRVSARALLQLTWAGSESALALEFRPGPLAVTTGTVWTGPRAGALGVRLREAP